MKDTLRNTRSSLHKLTLHFHAFANMLLDLALDGTILIQFATKVSLILCNVSLLGVILSYLPLILLDMIPHC